MRCTLAIVGIIGICACGGQQPADSAGGRITPVSGTVQPVEQDARGEEPAILRIRAHYAQIEREASGYRCRTLDLQGFSAEGGGLEACYAGNELRRLSATYLGESGRGKEQFYFWGDSLEFLFRQSQHYSQPFSGKVVATEEDRFYWSDGRLVRWVSGSRTQPLNTPEASEQAHTGRQTARQLAVCAAHLVSTVCEA